MNGRIVNYWQTPVAPEFARHMIEGIGLSRRDQQIAWRIRNGSIGDTQYYADEFDLPKNRYNEIVANINKREVAELIRLAQLGYQFETIALTNR